MRKINYLLVFLITIVLSCSNSNKTIEGVWVKEKSIKPIDTVTITKLKEQTYHIKSKYWKNSKPRVKSTTGEYKEDKLYFENGKSVFINPDEMIVNGTKYIKL